MILNLQNKVVRRNKKEIIRLVINLIIISVVLVGIILIVQKCRGNGNSEWELKEHPLKIENIRKIAEISTVSYSDEVVIDTIEKYDGVSEQLIGNVSKLSDIESWKYSIRGSDIKRRLTLIIGGEVRYGFDLKDTTFTIHYSGDTVFIQMKEPKILDVIVVPSKTAVFQEHGTWNDNTRIIMQQKAAYLLAKRSKKLNLEEKSKKQLELLLKKMIPEKNTLIVTYR